MAIRPFLFYFLTRKNIISFDARRSYLFIYLKETINCINAKTKGAINLFFKLCGSQFLILSLIHVRAHFGAPVKNVLQNQNT